MVVYKCIWMQKRLSKSIRIALKKLMIHFKTNINDIKETFFHFFFLSLSVLKEKENSRLNKKYKRQR